MARKNITDLLGSELEDLQSPKKPRQKTLQTSKETESQSTKSRKYQKSQAKTDEKPPVKASTKAAQPVTEAGNSKASTKTPRQKAAPTPPPEPEPQAPKTRQYQKAKAKTDEKPPAKASTKAAQPATGTKTVKQPTMLFPKSITFQIPDSEPSDGPKYLQLERKEVRLRLDQMDNLTAFTRRLNKARKGRGERLTENTLIRTAIDLLLENSSKLQGTTEDELRGSLGLPPSDSY